MSEPLFVNGIVLSQAPQGEYDRRVLLLTKELGRISAFARGARRTGSMLSASTRTFSFGKFEIYPGRDAYSIQKAEIKDYFEGLSSDIMVSLYAGYFAELVSKFTHENQPASEELTLFYYSLKALLKDNIPNELIKVCFELRLLTVFGTAVRFNECFYCCKKVSLGIFYPERQVFSCKDCAPFEGGIMLPPGALSALSFIESAPLNRLYTFSVTGEILTVIRACVGRMIEKNLEKPLKSAELLLSMSTSLP